ncbi:hypothetical protein D3C86_1244720 [compost metagenome]
MSFSDAESDFARLTAEHRQQCVSLLEVDAQEGRQWGANVLDAAAGGVVLAPRHLAEVAKRGVITQRFEVLAEVQPDAIRRAGDQLLNVCCDFLRFRFERRGVRR